MIDQLIYTLALAARPDKVWEAITDPTQTRRYFYDLAVRSTWREGARVTYQLPDGHVAMAGSLLEYEAPRRFHMTAILQFNRRLREEQASTIAWVVTPRGMGTALTLTHDGLASCPATRRMMRGSWPSICEGLVSYLAESTRTVVRCATVRQTVDHHFPAARARVQRPSTVDRAHSPGRSAAP
jgi:uncharacterized protein YndB with AHSA1/START domain